MPKIRSPKYRRQTRPSGDLAFVEIAGVRRYLGVYNSPESKNAYHRAVAEWIEGGQSQLLPATTQEITVAELVAKFWEHAETYFRKPDGTSSTELVFYKHSFKPLLKLYETSCVSQFGPRALKSVRQQLITDNKLNRKTLNGYVTRVKALFKWGVEQELVSPSIWHGLQAVAGLKRGRTTVPEPGRVHPVFQAHIDIIQPNVSRRIGQVNKRTDLNDRRLLNFYAETAFSMRDFRCAGIPDEFLFQFPK